MSPQAAQELLEAADDLLSILTMPVKDNLKKIIRLQKAVEKAKAEK